MANEIDSLKRRISDLENQLENTRREMTAVYNKKLNSIVDEANERIRQQTNAARNEVYNQISKEFSRASLKNQMELERLNGQYQKLLERTECEKKKLNDELKKLKEEADQIKNKYRQKDEAERSMAIRCIGEAKVAQKDVSVLPHEVMFSGQYDICSLELNKAEVMLKDEFNASAASLAGAAEINFRLLEINVKEATNRWKSYFDSLSNAIIAGEDQIRKLCRTDSDETPLNEDDAAFWSFGYFRKHLNFFREKRKFIDSVNSIGVNEYLKRTDAVDCDWLQDSLDESMAEIQNISTFYIFAVDVQKCFAERKKIASLLTNKWRRDQSILLEEAHFFPVSTESALDKDFLNQSMRNNFNPDEDCRKGILLTFKHIKTKIALSLYLDVRQIGTQIIAQNIIGFDVHTEFDNISLNSKNEDFLFQNITEFKAKNKLDLSIHKSENAVNAQDNINSKINTLKAVKRETSEIRI